MISTILFRRVMLSEDLKAPDSMQSMPPAVSCYPQPPVVQH